MIAHVPVEQVRAGDHVVLPSGQLREVARVEVYDAHGLEPVESFVVVYSALGAGRAWENRATAKNIASTFTREEGSLVPRRRGELVEIARGPNNPNNKETHMAIAVAPAAPSVDGSAAATFEQSIELLALDALVPAPDNPRKQLGDIDGLAASLASLGLLEPLVVTPRQGKFMVVCGHRRHAAAKKASLATVPAIVRELTEPQRIEAMVIENCQREDLTPLEEAHGYQALAGLGLSQRQIAADVGKGQSHISKRLALLELPAKAQAELDSGGITIDEARELLKLKDMPKRLETALREGKRSGRIDYWVSNQLHEHELAEKIGAATEKLKKTGVKIVTLAAYGDAPNGSALLVGKNGYAYDNRRLKIEPKKHAGEPCHAAAVDRRGEIVYLCTKPANHKGGAATANPDEKAAKAKERQREHAKMLRAREKNITLGATLDKKLHAPKIDARNMRVLVDLLMRGEFGTHLSLLGLRYVDEPSQKVVKRKDGTVSKIVHANDAAAARKLLTDRLAAAKTPEELMGVVLQALVAAKLADKNAVPPSQRSGYIPVLDRYSSANHITNAIAKIAAPFTGKAVAADDPLEQAA